MKSTLILFLALVPAALFGAGQAVTVSQDSAHTGTFNTAGVTSYVIGQPVTFTGGTTYNPLPIQASLTTIALLRSYTITSAIVNGSAIQVTGYYAANDGGGGVYVWNSTSTATDNGGTIIQATGVSTGRWLLQYGDYLNVRQFGATGAGTGNDASAIQAALAVCNKVVIPAGNYRLTSAITLASNQTLVGVGNSTILTAATDSMSVISATSVSHITVALLTINGGGSSSGTGVKAVTGVHLSGVAYFNLFDLTITQCGVVNVSAPTTDAGYGGFGILVDAVAGAGGYGRIDKCTVTNIAGGGNTAGDGIIVEGQNANTAITIQSVVVQDCYVSTVGRHCYTAGGGSGKSTSADIVFLCCYGEKSALCGLDVEDGNNVRVISDQFFSCGNNQTYFNPASAYGSTYRLLAGVACDNTDIDLVVNGCHISGCYYGITYGNTNGLTVANTRIDSSSTSDLSMLLANGPARMRFTNVICTSSSAIILTYNVLLGDSVVSGCDFTGNVIVSGTNGLEMVGCVFRAGLQIQGTSTQRLAVLGCTFLDYAGSGVYFSGVSMQAKECRVQDCSFIGTGNLINGIAFQYQDAQRWIINGNTFLGLTGSAVSITNGSDGGDFIGSFSHNVVKSCANGFVSTTGGLTNAVIQGNKFSSITGWCIDIESINSTGVFTGNTIAENVAGTSVVNGLRIQIGTGAWDYCVVLGNNWHNASGTKSLLDTGNTNGVTANNIIL